MTDLVGERLFTLEGFVELFQRQCPHLSLRPLARRLEEIPGARERVWYSAALELHADGRCDLMGAFGPTSELPERLVADAYFASLAVTEPWRRRPPPRDKVAWFEFDCVDGEPIRTYEMVSVDPVVLSRWSGRRTAEVGRSVRDDVSSALRLLEVEGRDEMLDATMGVVRELGEHGSLLHLGNLQRRSGGGLRLCAFVEVSQLCPWLRRIGWPGELRGLGRVLADLAPMGLALGVQLELEGAPDRGEVRVGSYLGLESPALYSDVALAESDGALSAWSAMAPAQGEQIGSLRTWLAPCDEISDDLWRRAVYCKFVWSRGQCAVKSYCALVPRV